MKEKIIGLIVKACEKGDEDFIEIALDLVPEKSREQVAKLANKVYKLYQEDESEEKEADPDLMELIDLALPDDKKIQMVEQEFERPPQQQVSYLEDYDENSEEMYEIVDASEIDSEYDDDDEDDDYYAEEFSDPIKTRGRGTVVRSRGPNQFNPNEYSEIGKDEDHEKFKAKSRPTKKPKPKKVKVKCSECNQRFLIDQTLFLGKGFGTKCNDCLSGV